MAAKKKIVAALSKLTKPEPVAITVSSVRTEMESALTHMAEAIAVAKAEELPQAHKLMKRIGDALEVLDVTVKRNLIAAVQQGGAQTTEKGSKEMLIGKFNVQISPTRTGYDSKKVEALCRAKGMDPGHLMDTQVVFKVNEGKQADAVKSGKMTADEMETCRYDVNFKVQKCEEVQ
jgi:hypothetical protein